MIASTAPRPRLRPVLLSVLFALLAALLPSLASGAEGRSVHHDLVATVDPEGGALMVVDTLQGLEGLEAVSLTLHRELEVAVQGDAWRIETGAEGGSEGRIGINEPGVGDGVPLATHRLVRQGDGPLVLAYSGVITHAVEREGEEYARSFSSTPGIVSPAGVYLGGAAAWIPTVVGAAPLFTYDLTVHLPPEWEAVSQGSRTAHRRGADGTQVRWEVPTPTEEAHLIAGRFHEYSRSTGTVEAQVFLRSEDPNLAAKYLEVTAQYVQMFSQLLGPYPYGKFALIENFWETGYGMPSFTLLGPQVIRFPFILHSSYPHEILHNWWGNSVYVDWQTGNWCEGLTAYLADHLVKEGQGQGELYRRDTLKKYRSYVSEGAEISLAEFRSRHSGATEAVGYGKSLMLWHMLRRDLGDDDFVRALSRLYRRHRYEVVGFGDIERIFSETAGRDLSGVFAQWVDRKGAPTLALTVLPPDDRHSDHSVVIRQEQAEEPYDLRVPVRVLYEGSDAVQSFTVPMTGSGGEAPPRSLSVALTGGKRPLWVSVDPHFDLFRRLDREEIPPSIGEVFGAERGLIVVPADGSIDAGVLTDAWDPGGRQFTVVTDDAIAALPTDRPTWVVGAENRFAEEARARAASRGIEVGARLRFGAESVARAEHCAVVVDRHPEQPDVTVGWILLDRSDALPGLARKLPHYGKYSYLAFEGAEPTNVVKGQFGTERSPLVWRADDFTGPAPTLPARAPLARLAPVFDPARLRATVETLVAPAMGGRASGTEGARLAAEWIADAFAEAGLTPAGGDDGWFDVWEEEGPDGPLTLRNVLGVLPGTDPSLAARPVVVGAHYDHLGTGWPDVRQGNEGRIHPGADDNASGVAVLVEVARLLAETHRPSRTIVFVAFDGEEWGRKGSIRLASRDAAGELLPPMADALGMLSLDAVGRLEGKKLLVLGTGTASEWIHIARGIGFTTGVESTAVADDPGGSDQVSFHEIGVSGVQLTSGPHPDFHRPSDTADRLDYPGMVKVAAWLREALVYLSERADPMTTSLAGARAEAPPRGSGRRVSLGTVPDFADPGPGVRVDSVLDGSPAAAAGLRGGDRLISIDGATIADLRAYSEVLRARAPGDTITIVVERDGARVTVEATLVAR
ncbi:MAG: M20/M25/M40 family metallo-hydrolase [Planctomycetota bacterium]